MFCTALTLHSKLHGLATRPDLHRIQQPTLTRMVRLLTKILNLPPGQSENSSPVSGQTATVAGVHAISRLRSPRLPPSACCWELVRQRTSEPNRYHNTEQCYYISYAGYSSQASARRGGGQGDMSPTVKKCVLFWQKWIFCSGTKRPYTTTGEGIASPQTQPLHSSQ